MLWPRICAAANIRRGILDQYSSARILIRMLMLLDRARFPYQAPNITIIFEGASRVRRLAGYFSETPRHRVLIA